MLLLDTGIHDDNGHAGSVIAERDGLVRLDPRDALRQRRTARPILDDASHDSTERFELAQPVRSHLNRHDRYRTAEVAHHAVRKPAKASCTSPWSTVMFWRCARMCSGRREVGFGNVRRLEFNQHSHGPVRQRLVVELGAHNRLLLGPA